MHLNQVEIAQFPREAGRVGGPNGVPYRMTFLTPRCLGQVKSLGITRRALHVL